MDFCDGTTHSWSDDSYSHGTYACPGYPRCKSEAVMRNLKAVNKIADEAAKARKRPKKSKAQQAADLEAEAARLKKEAAEDAIRERCTYQGVEWSRKGEAKAVYSEFVPCAAHHETYTDEYGMRVSCSTCRGSGEIYTTHYIRIPEYDAPQPPKEPV